MVLILIMLRERQEPSGWCINAYRCITCDFPPVSKYLNIILEQTKVCKKIHEPFGNLEGQPALLVIKTLLTLKASLEIFNFSPLLAVIKLF